MSTDATLASRAVRGGAVTVIGQAGRIGLQLVGLVVLSRLLDPVSFGIVAIAQVLVSTGEVIRDLGLTSAALQADSLSREQQSNLLWVGVSTAAALTGLGLAIVPFIDSIFDQHELGGVLAALLPLFMLNAAQAPFQIHLVRSSRFGLLVMADIAAQALGLVICCTAAWAGWEHWALVAQALTVGATGLALKASLSRWRPMRPQRNVGTRPLLVFGLHLSVAQVLNLISSNADTVALGLSSTPKNVGYYNRGYQLLSAPMLQLLSPLSNVAVPMLAKVRGERATFTAYLRRAQSTIAIPMVWVFTTSAALAGPVVSAILGTAWTPTADVFEVLAIGGAFQQLSFVSFWAFLSLGLTRELVRYNVVTKLGTVAAIIVGANWGMVGVAWAVAASLATSWFINLAWLSRTADLPALVFFRAGARIVALSAVSALAARQSHNALSDIPPWPALVISVAVGASLYLVLLLATPATRGDLQMIVRNLRRHRSA